MNLNQRVLNTEIVKAPNKEGKVFEYHTIESATEFANELFKKVGLHTWRFQVVTSMKKNNVGTCYSGRNLIILQARYFFATPKDEVEDTIIHEVAHAMAGHEAGHGPEWKAWCVKLGCKPQATVNLFSHPGFRKDWIWTKNTQQMKGLTQKIVDEYFAKPTPKEAPAKREPRVKGVVKTMPSKKAAALYREAVQYGYSDEEFLRRGMMEWNMKEGSTYHIAQLKLCKIHHETIMSYNW